MNDPRTVGFIGLGSMGLPIAKVLIKSGFDVTAYDVIGERGSGVESVGGRAATSPFDAASRSSTLALMVVDGTQAEEALFGSSGAADALKPKDSVVIFATIGPQAAKDLESRLSEREIRLLDAPVSGGPKRAAQGDLVVMAGGTKSLFEQLKPVLDAVGSTVIHCGENVGDGQAFKLVNQLLCAVHIAVSGEALRFAEALGLDPATVHDVLKKGAAGSFIFEDRGGRMVRREFETALSALDIFVKDTGLVVDAASKAGSPTPLTQIAKDIFEKGSALGFGRQDDSGVIRVFENWERSGKDQNLGDS